MLHVRQTVEFKQNAQFAKQAVQVPTAGLYYPINLI